MTSENIIAIIAHWPFSSTQLSAPSPFSTLHTYCRRGQPVVVSIVQINRNGDLAQIVFWGICRSVPFFLIRAVSILATPIVILLKFTCKFPGRMNVCELSSLQLELSEFVCLFTKWHNAGKLTAIHVWITAGQVHWLSATSWQFEEWNGICKKRETLSPLRHIDVPSRNAYF